MQKERDFKKQEQKWKEYWEKEGVYRFDPQKEGEVYSIDNPPPTISGRMHIGHSYSFGQQDMIARYRRMRGDNVFYPFGTDDNGLATEKLVEKENNVRMFDMSRSEFISLCQDTLKKIRPEFIQDWKDIAMSCDFSLNYSTISSHVQEMSQNYFIDLYENGRVYHKDGPTIWCPLCQTAIAQAELEDKEKESVFYEIEFKTEEGGLTIATTRPELLPACVSVFVHPSDDRYKKLIGKKATVPIFEQQVEIIADEEVDMEKGTGAVMCCTFGDVTDIEWFYAHKLPLRNCLTKDGKLNEGAGKYEGLSVEEARERVVSDLDIVSRKEIEHTINVHERCGTGVEIIPTKQWFIKYLDLREEFLRLGEELLWIPEHFKTRYMNWVKGLRWDWCVSRQRYFGIPFPFWHCSGCEKKIVAERSQLPVDPFSEKPPESCCGEVLPDENVLDTWATSALTPQIVQSLTEKKVFPMSLRPQAHDIINFWLFYTLARSKMHFDKLPWERATISGFVLDEKGKKMSKSKGNVVDPQKVISNYGADVLRYWISGTKFGEEARWSEKEINSGKRTLNKIWNAARFSLSHLEGYSPSERPLEVEDKWIVSKLNRTLKQYKEHFENYDYSKARKAVDHFFWDDFCGNYIEMIKSRLYDQKRNPDSAKQAMYDSLLGTLKMYAPFIPFITEEIYHEYFIEFEKEKSIHLTLLPKEGDIFTEESLMDEVVEVMSLIRKYKTEKSIPMGQRISEIVLSKEKEHLKEYIEIIKDTLRIDNIRFTESETEVQI